MTNKLSFGLRWTVVFLVLGLFTFYSLTAYAIVGGQDKVFAESIKKDKDFSEKDHFVSLDDDDDEDRGHGNFEHQKRICAINQSQLDLLKSSLKATVKTVKVDGKTYNVASVSKFKGVNKNTIYSTLGINRNSCKVIQEHKSFFLFLLPGVS